MISQQSKRSTLILSIYLSKKFNEDFEFDSSDFKIELEKDFPEFQRNFFDVQCKTFDEENFFDIGGAL